MLVKLGRVGDWAQHGEQCGLIKIQIQKWFNKAEKGNEEKPQTIRYGKVRNYNRSLPYAKSGAPRMTIPTKDQYGVRLMGLELHPDINLLAVN